MSTQERNVQLPAHLVNPAFGEVNVHERLGRKELRVTILMEPTPPEGTQTGVGIDGSASMVGAYGWVVGERDGKRYLDHHVPEQNEVSNVCREVIPYLAERLDADGGTTAVYWATGKGGASYDLIGDLTAQEARSYDYRGPSAWGTGTQLLPPLRYFAERFADASWGFYVFITDGRIADLDAVATYTLQLSHDIAAGRRNPLKCVLIGVGRDVDETQMAYLDDLNETKDAPVDLWDHKVAAEMRDLRDIFAEVVDAQMVVAPYAQVLDEWGGVVKDYGDGLPALIRFDLAPNATSFTLQLASGSIAQRLI